MGGGANRDFQCEQEKGKWMVAIEVQVVKRQSYRPWSDNRWDVKCMEHGGLKILAKMYNTVWNEGKIPFDWAEGIRAPLHKKRRQKRLFQL